MLSKQIGKFLVVGGTAAGIDFIVYALLVGFSGVPVPVAKAISFVAGAIFGFIANRSWTFHSRARIFKSSVFFGVVYLVSFFANVLTNSGVLWLFETQSQTAIAVAFIIATAMSATMNFIGMKFLVFRDVSEGKENGLQSRNTLL